MNVRYWAEWPADAYLQHLSICFRWPNWTRLEHPLELQISPIDSASPWDWQPYTRFPRGGAYSYFFTSKNLPTVESWEASLETLDIDPLEVTIFASYLELFVAEVNEKLHRPAELDLSRRLNLDCNALEDPVALRLAGSIRGEWMIEG